MIAPDRERLFRALEDSSLDKIQSHLMVSLDEKYANPKHGHFKDWQHIYQTLPTHKNSVTDFNQDAILLGHSDDISLLEQKELKENLQKLCPWRKGPFDIFGVYIDTEWRSDWKWQRIAPHVNLKDKIVLDIGCGNGYYALRMQGAGAKLVIGIDPSWHYIFQFHALQKYSSIEQHAFVLPYALEELPNSINSFDTIFSMGVLYHRQEPQVHLEQIYSLLHEGGQFILETLVIEDHEADILIPNDRYANMRNVWMIPSIELLTKWIIDVGFTDIKVVDTTMTTTEEQRQTEWMSRYSLAQALSPTDPTLTIEGHPAPLRATLIIQK